MGVGEDGGDAAVARGHVRLRRAAQRPERQAELRAQRQLGRRRKGVYRVLGVEDDEHVRHLSTYLQAPAGPSRAHRRRRTPAAVGRSGDDEARPDARGEEEAGLHRSDKGEAPRSRDELARHVVAALQRIVVAKVVQGVRRLENLAFHVELDGHVEVALRCASVDVDRLRGVGSRASQLRLLREQHGTAGDADAEGLARVEGAQHGVPVGGVDDVGWVDQMARL
mmetsp:Transcript_27689/g.93035  ORF Transcript_27689/g.93035 Transcript_27689/m.93035 type:complete len:224 (+) Transcript_27689:370-1041(+)